MQANENYRFMLENDIFSGMLLDFREGGAMYNKAKEPPGDICGMLCGAALPGTKKRIWRYFV